MTAATGMIDVRTLGELRDAVTRLIEAHGEAFPVHSYNDGMGCDYVTLHSDRPLRGRPNRRGVVMTATANCGAMIALDHGDWAEESMNACELPAGHEPPHRQRFPAQHGLPAYTVEWADEAWWSE